MPYADTDAVASEVTKIMMSASNAANTQHTTHNTQHTTHTHTHTRPFNGPFPGLPGWAGTRKVKPLWILLKQESEWQWHQLGHMQVCTSLQTDNHASISPLSFLQARCPSCRPTNSVKALKAIEKLPLQYSFRYHLANCQRKRHHY